MNLHRIFTHILETPEVTCKFSDYQDHVFGVNSIRIVVEGSFRSQVNAQIGDLWVVNIDEDALIAAIIEAQQGKTVDQIVETFRQKGFMAE